MKKSMGPREVATPPAHTVVKEHVIAEALNKLDLPGQYQKVITLTLI